MIFADLSDPRCPCFGCDTDDIYCEAYCSKYANYNSKKENEKRYPNPDWEICWTCNKKYTEHCSPSKCNPLDL